VQCLSIFPILLGVFVNIACVILCGTNITFLAFVVIIPSSHNITAFLCYCNVDHFIPVITILMYDYKPALNTLVKKSSVVGTCKP